MGENNKTRKPRGKAVPFEEIVRRFEEFKSEYGHMYIPVSYVTKDGFNLGTIVNSIRTGNRKVTDAQKRILDDMGFVWNITDKKELPLYCRPCNYTFEEIFEALVEYKRVNGNLLVPQLYITEKGMRLGSIVSRYRCGSIKLTDEQKEKLDKIGFVWQVRNKWIPMNIVIRLFEEYRQKYGNLDIPIRYVTEDNIRLGNIANNMKRGNRKINARDRKTLIEMGFTFKE